MNNRSNTVVKLFSISTFFITSLTNAQHMLVSEITPRLSTTVDRQHKVDISVTKQSYT